MQPHHSNFWKWKDKEFRFDIYASGDFDDLVNVKQVYALVLSKDRKQVLVVYNKSGFWMLPGGGIEDGESQFETLLREVKEETNREVVISSITPLFYQKAYKKDEVGEWEFTRTEVRYSAVVKKDLEFVSDPDNGDVIEARWVNVSELEKYLEWGKTVELIKNSINR